MPTILQLWNDRLSWSSEIPTNYPGLNASALSRINELGAEYGHGSGTYPDSVDTSRAWSHESAAGALWGRANGPRGGRFQINGSDPATEQSRLELQHFDGLWPDSGRVLIGLWVWQRFSMTFNPLIDTRATDPFVYLSTAGGTGQVRMQVYSSGGSLVLDQYEANIPWTFTTEAYFVGFMVDDSGYAQMFSVHNDGRVWVGSERTFTGSANFGSTANVDVFSLRHANYWESGFFDEVLVAHPSSDFDLQEFAQDIGDSVWANGNVRPDRDDDFDINNDRIERTASGTGTFRTGAERLSWTQRPTISDAPNGQLQISTDDGDTWEDTSEANLPEVADDVLLRWNEVSLASGESYSGSELTIPDDPDEEVTPSAPEHDAEANTVTVTPQDGVVWSQVGVIEIEEGGSVTVTAEPESGYTFPDGADTEWTFDYTYPNPPEIEPIPNVELEQGGDEFTYELTYSAEAPYTWEVDSPSLATVNVSESGELTVSIGFETGTGTVEVSLTDSYGRTATRTFEVTVTPREWEEGPPPSYPDAPIILYENGEPEEILMNPVTAYVIEEVNGTQSFEFTIPANHRLRRLIYNENIVKVAGEKYWIRRVTAQREQGTAVFLVYCEARFYELGTMGGIEPQEWSQVLPISVMETALEETPWSVGVVNVGTRRTYELEERTNPLAVLRMIQENHGGDLRFDNENQEVNLLVQSGRNQGVGFFYGSNLSDSTRVVDTSSLVTRIYARDEEGNTIAPVNDGVEYVEDFSYTDEVKTATYNFSAGTSAFTMLDMATATLANRSRPDISYECTVNDLSARTNSDLDRFACGDIVTVADPELGIEGDEQRITRFEYDLLEPWNSEITLSARLRETGTSDGTEDSLATGATVDTFDLVPFNLLLNARFDNQLAHWANSGVEIIESDMGTGDYAVRFEGSGTRWIEQTVTPDNRQAYAFSFEVNARGGPQDWVPDVRVEAEVTYEDGETEVVEIDLGGDGDYARDSED